jgi:P27 family predicted phage terminase small subunit
MAPRGKKPKPTHLKLVTGTFRRHRAPKNEPKPELAIPPVPPELSDDAKLEWGRVSLDLHRLGLMTHIDRAALAAYCDSYGLWIRTRRLLAKIGEDGADGLLTKTVQGNIIQNPLIGIANKAKRDMMAYAEQFGITPSSQARLSAPPPPDGRDLTEKYFSAGPRD